MRFSKQREVVYAVLCQASHADVSRIYGEARKQMPKISLATVYRNLHELCAEGRAKRIDAGGSVVFDARTCDHAHFVCTVCNAVSDAQAEVHTKCCNGQILRSEVVLYGICPQCQSAQQNTKGE